MAHALVDIFYIGSVYALFALGYVLTFGVTGSVNFAHPVTFTAGAFVALALIKAGYPFWLAGTEAVVAGGMVGIAIDRLALWPLRLRNGATLWPLIGSIGAATACVGVLNARFGTRSLMFPASVTRVPAAHFGSLTFDGLQLTMTGICIIAILAVHLLLRTMRLGAAMRAVSEHPVAARSVGVNVESIVAQTMFVASMLGAIAGLAFATYHNRVDPALGNDLALSGLAAVVLGGLGSVPGTIAAAYVIATLDVAAAAWLHGSGRDVVAFAVIIGALVVARGGLMPSRTLRPA